MNYVKLQLEHFETVVRGKNVFIYTDNPIKIQCLIYNRELFHTET